MSYDDSSPWAVEADGSGRSLVFTGGQGADRESPFSWRPSLALGGNPGSTDELPLLQDASGDALLDYAGVDLQVVTSPGGGIQLVATSFLAADAVVITPQWSSTLEAWTAAGASLMSQEIDLDGNYRRVWQLSTTPLPERFFARLLVSPRE